MRQPSWFALAWIILILPNLACKDDPERKSSPTPAIAQHVGDTAVFDLRLINGDPVPQTIASDVDGCTERVLSGWYKIVSDRWVSFDSVSRTCSAEAAARASAVARYSGRLRKQRDTLLFVTNDSVYGELPIDRGIERNDTLFTRGEDYGPARVYLRRHNP